MKKLIFCTMCFMALTLNAQRCVVLDFQIGDNVTAEEVDAVSYEFRSTFNPSCYTVEDYFRVKRIMKELGYNSAAMRKEQIRKFGRDMVATVVVSGTLSKFMDEYTLDVVVMDVSTGTTKYGSNTNFQKSEYRTHPRAVAQSIVSQLCGASSGVSVVSGSTSSKKTVAQGYTDLGLPSGTLWKDKNQSGFYTYDEAVRTFSGKLPTKEQWEELKAFCEWTWTGNGYKVTGDNGNSIVLPAAGNRNCLGNVSNVGSRGHSWSSTPYGSDDAWSLNFDSGGVGMLNIGRCIGLSVRLVQD